MEVSEKKMRVFTLFLLIVVTIAEEVDISKTISSAKEVDISKVISNPSKICIYGIAFNHTKEFDKSEVINPSEFCFLGKVIDPAKEADIGETINNLLFDYDKAGVHESPEFKKNVMHCNSHVVDTCSSGTRLHHHDNGIINNQNGLALCLFESMEKCLKNHGTSLNLFAKTSYPIPNKPIIVPPIEPNNYKPITPPIDPNYKPIIPPIEPNKPIFGPDPKEAERTIIIIIPIPPKEKLKTFPSTSKENQQLPSVSLQIPMATQYQSLLVETLKFQTVLKTCTHVSAQTCYNDPNLSKSVLAACLMPSMNQCIYPTATTPGN